MKRKIITAISLLCLLTGCSNLSIDEINKGMDVNKMIEAISNSKTEYFAYANFYFFSKSNYNFVAKIKEDLVDRIVQYEIADVEDNDFTKINIGDDMFDVVEKVGLPIFDSHTYGITSLVFISTTGNLYRIAFNDGGEEYFAVSYVVPVSE